MKGTILGKKHSCIEENGKQKNYYKLFILHKAPRDNEFTKYEGLACAEVSVPPDIFNEAIVDRDCCLDFDCNKKLLDFELL